MLDKDATLCYACPPSADVAATVRSLDVVWSLSNMSNTSVSRTVLAASKKNLPNLNMNYRLVHREEWEDRSRWLRRV